MSNEVITTKQDTAVMPFEQMERMANIFASSRLFAVQGWDTPEKILTLMMIAQAENIQPVQAIQRYDFIKGRISKKSQTMLEDYLRLGGKVKYLKSDAEVCEMEFTNPDEKTGNVRRYTIQMARQAGLVKPDSGYVKNPDAMLRARCISSGLRMFYPAVTALMMSSEEAMDVDYIEIPAVQNNNMFTKSQAIPAEVLPTNEPSKVAIIDNKNHKAEVLQLIADKNLTQEAWEFLSKINYIQEGEPLESISEHHCKMIMERPEKFLEAIKKEGK
jgi:hypothetical protein